MAVYLAANRLAAYLNLNLCRYQNMQHVVDVVLVGERDEWARLV
jgi:hypothetical protein